MNVDVLIVVDVGFPLLEAEQARQRAGDLEPDARDPRCGGTRFGSARTLTDRDVVIDPPLGDASSFDFGIVTRADRTRVSAARGARSRSSPHSSVSPEEYSIYTVKPRRHSPRHAARRVRARGAGLGALSPRRSRSCSTTWWASRSIRRQLGRRVTGFYGQRQSRGARLRAGEGLDQDRYGLALSARRNSWGPNYVRFGLNLQDDFEGNSSLQRGRAFRAHRDHAARRRVGVGSAGRRELALRDRGVSAVLAELGRTSSCRTRSSKRATLPCSMRSSEPSPEYRVRSLSYGLDFGREFGNWGEIRAGYCVGPGQVARARGRSDAAGGRVRFRRLFPAARRTTSSTTSTSRATASSRRCSGAASAPASARIRPPTASRSTGSPRARSGGRRRCCGLRSARR